MGLLTEFSSKAEIHRREVIKRFDDFFASYFSELESREQELANDRVVTLIARGPASPVTQAVCRHADRLALSGVKLQVVFAHIDPPSDFSCFVEKAGEEKRLDVSIRWAKNPALLDAHEQLVLGASHCWSGDAMRRSPDVRVALDMYEVEGGDAVRWGKMAFHGLWTASVLVPKSRFRHVGNATSDDPAIMEFEEQRDQLWAHEQSGAWITRH